MNEPKLKKQITAISLQNRNNQPSGNAGGVGGFQMFLFGGLSAQVAAVFTNPIDVLKVRLQIQGEHSTSNLKISGTPALNAHNLGFFRMAESIIRKEGVLSLWKGIIPSLLREISYSSIRLGAYEPIRNFLSSPGETEVSFTKKLLAGATSGAIGSGLANPIDLVKVQQQAIIGSSDTINNRNTFSMLQNIYLSQGLKGLFRGVGPTIQRAALLTATQLGTYDHIKQTLLRLGNGKYFKEGALLHFCSGTIAGLAVAVVTSPVDTIRTRLMNQPVDPVSRKGLLYKGSIDCLVKTMKHEGMLAIYKGFMAQWMRVGPHTTISLVCFEGLRKTFGLKAI